ncbi:MAG: peptidoglycan-binding domain-containing protein [Planktothrix sp. GU0601_MAG3]|nr:MAG: peptidoglycan-binding domain-containing protein [Planktothrix sp. GU0601_MAG3]
MGYFNANSTGYYGKLTASAVKSFQYNCGLSADGIAGPATLAALGI